MRKFFYIILIVAGIVSGPALAQNVAPEPILPSALNWASPPSMPGVQGAWVTGADQKPGNYLLRVKLQAGAKIPPHTHPDERSTTVLTGTIYVGFAASFDETKIVAVPTGGVYLAPANVPHYIWAKDGEAMYQEAGTGPTRTSFLEK